MCSKLTTFNTSMFYVLHNIMYDNVHMYICAIVEIDQLKDEVQTKGKDLDKANRVSYTIILYCTYYTV